MPSDGVDAEAAARVIEGARVHAREAGLRVVYDRSYPPGTVDFLPIVRAISAEKPDLVFASSYPIDTVGLIRAAREVNLRATMLGGAMVGLQYASIRAQLGDALNGVVGFELWVPSRTMRFPGSSGTPARSSPTSAASGCTGTRSGSGK